MWSWPLPCSAQHTHCNVRNIFTTRSKDLHNYGVKIQSYAVCHFALSPLSAKDQRGRKENQNRTIWSLVGLDPVDCQLPMDVILC